MQHFALLLNVLSNNKIKLDKIHTKTIKAESNTFYSQLPVDD